MGFTRQQHRELVSGIPVCGGTPEMEHCTHPFPQKDSKTLGAGQNPQRGRISHGPMSPTQNLVAILDTQSRQKSLWYRFPATRISNPKELTSGSADQACHHLLPNPNPSCVYRCLSPNPWPPNPPVWGLSRHATGLGLTSPRKLCPSQLPKPSGLGEI